MKLIIDMYSMYTLNPLYTISEILHVSHRLVPFNLTEFNTTLGIVMPNLLSLVHWVIMPLSFKEVRSLGFR